MNDQSISRKVELDSASLIDEPAVTVRSRRQEEANKALQILSDWTSTMALTLHPTKICIVNAVTDEFNFPGYRFVNNSCIVGDKSIRKLKDTIRSKTKRSRGDSLNLIIHDVNKTLWGWFEYFKHSRPCSFTPLDKWIRMCLRSVLRKQLKMKHGA